MKRLLTILFLCCCISMYAQNNGQSNNTNYNNNKNNGDATTKSSKVRQMSPEEEEYNEKKIKAQLMSKFREMTDDEAKKMANQFNAILDEAGIYGYRVSPEDILKMWKEIGYIDLRPIQNSIDKRIDKQIDKRKKIEQWIINAKDCNKQLDELFKNIDKKKSKDEINRQKQTLLETNQVLKAKYEDVKKRGKELGVSNITEAENASKNSLTEQKKLENLKTQLIDACNGNCLTK